MRLDGVDAVTCPQRWRARERPTRVAIVALAVVFAASLRLAPNTASAQSHPEAIGVDEYLSRVQQAIEVLEGHPRIEPGALEDAREALPAGPVELRSGDVAHPPALLPTEQLRPDPAGAPTPEPGAREAALARLKLVEAQLLAARNDNTAARLQLLEDVLARPEFTVRRSLLDRFMDWLAELLPDATIDLSGPGQVVEWSIAAAGSILIVLVFTYWLRGLLARLADDAQLADDSIDRGGRPTSAREAARLASSAARAASYREAVRQLYHFALLSLDEIGALEYDSGLTNREHLALMPGASGLAERFAPVVATFDEVWYGEHEPDRDVFETYKRAVDSLLSAAKRQSRDPARAPAHDGEKA